MHTATLHTGETGRTTEAHTPLYGLLDILPRTTVRQHTHTQLLLGKQTEIVRRLLGDGQASRRRHNHVLVAIGGDFESHIGAIQHVLLTGTTHIRRRAPLLLSGLRLGGSAGTAAGTTPSARRGSLPAFPRRLLPP